MKSSRHPVYATRRSPEWKRKVRTRTHRRPFRRKRRALPRRPRSRCASQRRPPDPVKIIPRFLGEVDWDHGRCSMNRTPGRPHDRPPRPRADLRPLGLPQEGGRQDHRRRLDAAVLLANPQRCGFAEDHRPCRARHLRPWPPLRSRPDASDDLVTRRRHGSIRSAVRRSSATNVTARSTHDQGGPP